MKLINAWIAFLLIFEISLTVHAEEIKSRERYLEIIQQVSNLYAQDVREMGAELIAQTDWENQTSNAYARRVGNKWLVYFPGGGYRDYRVSDDGFAATVCHEIGHHLGGAPYKLNFGADWASAEGQADFWASAICLKKYFRAYPKVVNLDDRLIKKKCDNKFDSVEDRSLCYRIALAGLSKAQYYNDLNPNKNNYSLTLNNSISEFTIVGHPDSQCRYDTYIAGALCNIQYVSGEEFDNNLLAKNSNPSNSFTCEETIEGKLTLINKRPLCWFNPNILFFSLDYATEVQSKSFFSGYNNSSISVNFVNNLNGIYTIRLIPSLKTAQVLSIQNNEIKVYLESKTFKTIIFAYKFIKKTNETLNFKLVTEFFWIVDQWTDLLRC